MKSFHTKLVAVLIGISIGSIAEAAVTGSAKIIGCMPFGGVEADCQVKKTLASDPQIWHSMNCILDKDDVIQKSYFGPNHSPGSGTTATHGFPAPPLTATFEEGVTYCVKNFSNWWNPPVSAGDVACKSTSARDE